MLVMNDSRYGQKVPFVIGTIHIHAALEVMTEEWDNMTLSWQSVALPACASKASGMGNFSLDNVGGMSSYTKPQYCHPLALILSKVEVQ